MRLRGWCYFYFSGLAFLGGRNADVSMCQVEGEGGSGKRRRQIGAKDKMNVFLHKLFSVNYARDSSVILKIVAAADMPVPVQHSALRHHRDLRGGQENRGLTFSACRQGGW